FRKAGRCTYYCSNFVPLATVLPSQPRAAALHDAFSFCYSHMSHFQSYFSVQPGAVLLLKLCSAHYGSSLAAEGGCAPYAFSFCYSRYEPFQSLLFRTTGGCTVAQTLFRLWRFFRRSRGWLRSICFVVCTAGGGCATQVFLGL